MFVRVRACARARVRACVRGARFGEPWGHLSSFFDRIGQHFYVLGCMLVHVGTKLDHMRAPVRISRAFGRRWVPPGAVSGSPWGLPGTLGDACEKHLDDMWASL